MKSKSKCKKISIKSCTCCYFDNIMKVDEEINVDKILLDKKSYKNILV